MSSEGARGEENTELNDGGQHYREQVWGAFYREGLKLGGQNSLRNPYTSLPTDDFYRWLCPNATCKRYQNDPEWDWLHLIGFVTVEDDHSRAVLSIIPEPSLFPDAEVMNVAYFANPPATRYCLHKWRTPAGIIIRCGYDRMNHLPVKFRGPENVERVRKTCDPGNQEGLKALTLRVKPNAAILRYPDFKDSYDQFKNTWACPKCCIFIHHENLAPEWQRHAIDACKMRGDSPSKQYMSAFLHVNHKQPPLEFFCWINAFCIGENGLHVGYICTNKRFGDGPERQYVECGYQYGEEPDWELIGKFYKYTGPRTVQLPPAPPAAPALSTS